MAGPDRPLYLDHNATTPLDPEVRAEVVAALDLFGNASSLHGWGQAARRVLDVARLRVARLLRARPEDLLFTSGGTEADNLAILGVTGARPGVVIRSAVEHQAVLQACDEAARRGCPVHVLPVDAEGRLDPGAGWPRGVLASVMLANNDTGVILPVVDVVAARRADFVHTDAVQAAGRLSLDVGALGVDLLTLSAHKIHGPKGVGALWVRPGTPLHPLVFGGHQERGLRPGTENVAAIAGFGRACLVAADRLEADAARLGTLRDAFEATVRDRLPGVTVNGAGAPRVPNTSNLSFPGVDGDLLVIHLDLLGVAASTGAACAAADREPSHVLLAMGRTREEARSTVRFALGRDTTEDDVALAVDRVVAAVTALGGLR